MDSLTGKGFPGVKDFADMDIFPGYCKLQREKWQLISITTINYKSMKRGFKPISVNDFIKQYLVKNPSESEKEVRQSLNKALTDFKNGVKCTCGNDIWVIGSAFAGNSCFSCITGESYPSDDYEIDQALEKTQDKKGRRHIDDMDPAQIAGFFDDDGYEIDTNLIKKPPVCLTCVHDNDPEEETLCTLTRYDQRNKKEFKCFAYKKIK